jgi:hypothetical protein
VSAVALSSSQSLRFLDRVTGPVHDVHCGGQRRRELLGLAVAEVITGGDIMLRDTAEFGSESGAAVDG